MTGKTIDIKLEPSRYVKISIKDRKIELSDIDSIKNDRGGVSKKQFLRKKILEITFSCPDALQRNKEKLDLLKNLTNSEGEITSPIKDKGYKNIYMIGFPIDYTINTSH